MLDFAGELGNREADSMLSTIQIDKNQSETRSLFGEFQDCRIGQRGSGDLRQREGPAEKERLAHRRYGSDDRIDRHFQRSISGDQQP